MTDEILYNDPAGGTASEIGPQIRTDWYNKKALVEAQKEQYFGQLASTIKMPKNMGKKIKRFHYLPILDDRNINDQGIDAAGKNITTGSQDSTITITTADGEVFYAVGTAAFDTDQSTTAAAALAAAKTVAHDILIRLTGLDRTDVLYDTYAEVKAIVEAYSPAWTVSEGTAVAASGNLYGSSKDIGYITGKLPALSESGGRVNRVGMKRIELEGTFEKFGFFDEYSQESMDFDSDEDLEMHIISESVKAANEMTEDQLQIDLLTQAGVIRYTGGAANVAALQGNTSIANADTVEYIDLVKLDIVLDNNRTPKHTTIIAGSRLTDTKVVNAARYMYIGSELQTSIMRMTDFHSEKAFIPVAQYASAGTVARGEFGAVGNFRIIVVPEMMKWGGVGAAVTANAGFYETGGNFDVFPMLVVGEESFTTIGFNTDGSNVKFKIKHVKPGSDISYSKDDPFGEMGFYSIKWYYGFMLYRSERLAVIKTVAEY